MIILKNIEQPSDGEQLLTTEELAEIDAMMLAKGFEHLTAGAYYDAKAGLLVFDLFLKNAKLAEDGVVYPIDPVVQRIDPEFGQFLRENPDRINNR